MCGLYPTHHHPVQSDVPSFTELSQSSSPPLLEVCSPAPFLEMQCWEFVQPSAAPEPDELKHRLCPWSYCRRPNPQALWLHLRHRQHQQCRSAPSILHLRHRILGPHLRCLSFRCRQPHLPHLGSSCLRLRHVLSALRALGLRHRTSSTFNIWVSSSHHHHPLVSLSHHHHPFSSASPHHFTISSSPSIPPN